MKSLNIIHAVDVIDTHAALASALVGHDDGHRPWLFPLFPFGIIAVWVSIWIVFGRRRWRHVGRRHGESVLAERYARGEIDETEYAHRREVLRGK